MSNYRKANLRLIQPRPEHYKERGSIKYLCGPYSLEQRDKYFEAMISLHKTRHPDIKQSIARRAVFQKWRNLVFATIDDEYISPVDSLNKPYEERAKKALGEKRRTK